MFNKSIEARLAVLEIAVGSALGISLAEFDESAVQAKREAEAQVHAAKVKAEQDAKAVEDARLAAQHEADVAADKAIAARADAILKQAKKAPARKRARAKKAAAAKKTRARAKKTVAKKTTNPVTPASAPTATVPAYSSYSTQVKPSTYAPAKKP